MDCFDKFSDGGLSSVAPILSAISKLSVQPLSLAITLDSQLANKRHWTSAHQRVYRWIQYLLPPSSPSCCPRPPAYINTAVSATHQLPTLLEDFSTFPILAKNKSQALLGTCRWCAHAATLDFSSDAGTQKCRLAYTKSKCRSSALSLGKWAEAKSKLKGA